MKKHSHTVTKNDLELQPNPAYDTNHRLSWIPILLVKAVNSPSVISLDYFKYCGRIIYGYIIYYKCMHDIRVYYKSYYIISY